MQPLKSVRSAVLAVVAIAVLTPSLLGAAPAIASSPRPMVTGIDVATSESTIYPVIDGYRDSLTITSTAFTGNGEPSAARGYLEITHGSEVVSTWPLWAATPAIEKWNGRVGGKIVAGKYDITAVYANANATIVRETISVTVSTKKLVAHHWSKTVQAWPAHTSCSGGLTCYIEYVHKALPPTVSGGVIHFHYKTLTGIDYAGGPDIGDGVGSVAEHSLLIPSAARSSVKGSLFVSASAKVTAGSGHKFRLTMCGYSRGTTEAGNCGNARTLTKSGTAVSPTVALTPGSTRANWLVSVSQKTQAHVLQFTVHLTYYSLR